MEFMKNMSLQFVYGSEFWATLEALITKSSKRIFLMSAYWGNDVYENIKAWFPAGVTRLMVSRIDSKFRPQEAVLVSESNFHGKLYVIDDHVLIGSQNLNRAADVREGEFSVLFSTDTTSASTILYQALLKSVEKESAGPEPAHATFVDIYNELCPFCGNREWVREDEVIKCVEYGQGSGYVTKSECISYGDSGACKNCTATNSDPCMGCYIFGSDVCDENCPHDVHQKDTAHEKSYCCDSSGCGMGITEDGYLIHHAINAQDKAKVEKVKDFLRLYNVIAAKHGTSTPQIFKMLGLCGCMLNANIDRDVYQFGRM